MDEETCRPDDAQAALDDGVAKLASLIAWLQERELLSRPRAEPLGQAAARGPFGVAPAEAPLA
jgi:hypothetical protein